MPIQFPCPACQQPIEVDDQWGGQSVACPYCQRAVTAPLASTWAEGQIPQAHPTRPAPSVTPQASRPFPDGGTYPTAPPLPKRSSAPAALALAIACAVLSAFALFVWIGSLAAQVVEKTGPNPSPEAMRQVMEEILQSGAFHAPKLAILALFGGVFCGLAGLILAVRSLLRQESRRAMAVIACLTCACFLCCQLVMMLASFAQPMP